MRKSSLFAAVMLAVGVVGSAPSVFAAPGRGRGPEQRAPKPKNVVVSGVVSAVSGTAVTIHQKGGGRNGRDVVVNLTDTTQYLAGDGSTVDATSVQVGAKIQAKGTQAADGVITATRVLIVKAAPTTTTPPTP